VRFSNNNNRIIIHQLNLTP